MYPADIMKSRQKLKGAIIMTNKSMGSFLAELRKEKGVTQKELADYLNVSDKTVSHWECDNYSPDISVIPVLAEFFGVTCDELLKGEKKPPEYNENSFSYEPLTKENEFEKYARIRILNAYNKLKASNIISVFVSAFVLAFLVIIVFIIDYYIPTEFGVLVSAGFSACLGILISYLAYNKFVSVLNFSHLSPKEYKLWKKKANMLCIFPIIYAVLMFLFIVFMMMPNRNLYVDTQTMPLSDALENEGYYAVDPSEVVSGEVVVSAQDNSVSQEGYLSGEVTVAE